MRPRDVSNPLNRFRELAVRYDDGEGPPPAKVKLLEDSSRTILSRNDSPDLGFRWSANPYRGCLHACAYCLDPHTPILMGDGRTRPLADLRVGDEIIGTVLRGRYRRYTRTRVLAHWQTRKPAYRIALADGTELVASGDHRFLTDRGWKHVMPADAPARRPHLTTSNRLVGVGAFASSPVEDDAYRRGYLCGMIRGDGTLRRYDYAGRRRPGVDTQHRFRLALVDLEALSRSDRYLAGLSVVTQAFDFAVADGARPMRAITRKWDLDGQAVKHAGDLRVISIEPVGVRELLDITTGTGDFVANGVVSHNCYARPTHEYLDLGAGTDFDTRIVVKREAPELLREAFDRPSWQGELVMFSGVTDCYQPIEKELELTRRCLEVCLEYRNPVSVISKSALVLRDVELFRALAAEARFHIAVSLAFTDDEQARAIEPWAASPTRRFKVIEALAKAGLPVSVMIAPVIPGVNDSQLVGVLERAAAAGATSAGWTLLRLPGAVKEVFDERLRAVMPLAADKVLHRIRETRGGDKLYDARFHSRGRGEGPYAAAIASMFAATCARLGFAERHDDHDEDAEPTTFRRPPPRTGQLSLF